MTYHLFLSNNCKGIQEKMKKFKVILYNKISSLKIFLNIVLIYSST